MKKTYIQPEVTTMEIAYTCNIMDISIQGSTGDGNGNGGYDNAGVEDMVKGEKHFTDDAGNAAFPGSIWDEQW